MKLIYSILFLCLGAGFLQAQNYEVSLIGFYNLENLFDTIDIEGKNDIEFTPEGSKNYGTELYTTKLRNMARVISQIGTNMSGDGLALLGVCEIENRKVLEDLCQEPSIRDRGYQIVHYETQDFRGIDNALLYNPKYFVPLSSDKLFIQLPDKNGEKRFTRDVLYVRGLLRGEEIHIMVNHWPSRGGGQAASEPKRVLAAEVCRSAVDSILAINPEAQILIMGDFNDDPDNISMAEVLRAADKPFLSEEERVKAEAKLKKLEAKLRSTNTSKKKDALQSEVNQLKANLEMDLYNPYAQMFKDGQGTLAYRGTWNLFDQIVLSRGMLKKEGFYFHDAKVFRQPWMFQREGEYKGYPLRSFVGSTYLNGFSDHLPAYVILLKDVK